MSPAEKRQSDPHLLRSALAFYFAKINEARRYTGVARGHHSCQILLALYVWILKSERIKRLWHDELYTFYIAQAPTFDKMMEWILHHRFETPSLLHRWLGLRFTCFLHPHSQCDCHR